MLAVYVDGIIITVINEKEIAQLKLRLEKNFEVKDLGHTFLGLKLLVGQRGLSYLRGSMY
jgi:hypothetical protein